MRFSLLPLATAVALALAGCGGSSATTAHTKSAPVTASPASTPTTTKAAQPTTPATTSTPTTSTPTTSTAPAQAAGTSRCWAADLSGSFLGGQAATGHGLLGFALKNTSNHTCVALGYPGIQWLTRAGQALPTVPTHTRNDFFGPLPIHPWAVAPGTTVSFRLGVTHGAASTAGCATAYGLQVIPPNDTVTLRIAIPNGAYECQATTVSPLEPNTSAYP